MNHVTAMVSGQLRRHITGYHMSKLTDSALRIHRARLRDRRPRHPHRLPASPRPGIRHRPHRRRRLNEDTPPFQIASDLGISLGHLRQVLRRHPLPGVIYLAPVWLRREYLTWHRSLDDIAAQIGCPLQSLNRFARDHGIEVRSRGTSSYIPAGSAPGIHPRDLPEPLRSALVGRRARRRLDDLLIIAGHASIRQAAQALGRWPSAVYDQLGRTERACGGPLVIRSPQAPGTGILTPLGEQLCQQARDYLQPAETRR